MEKQSPLTTAINKYRHADEVQGALTAAERIVPLVLETIGEVRSVVDLGGGTGVWLRRFQMCGVPKVMLIDRPDVEPDLVIDRTCFQAADLNKSFPSTSRFDLAVCVECAEHLRADRAQPLVEWLTGAADRIVFSAAIPGQGGKGHINERLPSYWSKLFRQRGFVRRDVLRRSLIMSKAIPWWYRQNLLLYTSQEVVLKSKEMDFVSEEFVLTNETLIENMGTRFLFRQLVRALGSTLRRRLRRSS